MAKTNAAKKPADWMFLGVAIAFMGLGTLAIVTTTAQSNLDPATHAASFGLAANAGVSGN